jgi:double-stranded uracil-DNA glycosylase
VIRAEIYGYGVGETPPPLFEVDGETVRTLPDLLAPGLRILFVGFNPSVRAARLGHYYAGRNNRFWELLHVSGLTTERIPFERDREVLRSGMGITDLVKRPTRSASEVTGAEYRAGRERLIALLTELRPRVVCYNGKGVYLQVTGRVEAPWGEQHDSVVSGVLDFVAPSPSGLATIPMVEKVRRFSALRTLVEKPDR